jgi:hypothetical protein
VDAVAVAAAAMTSFVNTAPWMVDAACIHVGDGPFFVDKGESSNDAKLICNGSVDRGVPPCQVRDQCLQYALDHDDEHGIWGGLSPRERRQVRGNTRPCAVCGTEFPRGPNAKYCSDDCRREAHNQQDNASHARRLAA